MTSWRRYVIIRTHYTLCSPFPLPSPTALLPLFSTLPPPLLHTVVNVIITSKRRWRQREKGEGLKKKKHGTRCKLPSPIQMTCTPIAWSLPQMQTPHPPILLPFSLPSLPSFPHSFLIHVQPNYVVLEGKVETNSYAHPSPSLLLSPFSSLSLSPLP